MAAGGSKEMEIAIKIAGKVESSFKSALGQAAKGLGSVTKAVAGATAAAASAVGAMGVAAVNVGKEFETSMSQVAATMLIDKTTAKGQKNFEMLENAARECGRSTAFSASEAAEGLNNLAMAGYGAKKAAAALPTVLNLAGAGALELGQSAEMITAGMASLGLKQTEEGFQHFSDVLAITASKAKTNVAGIGDAVTTVGGTAANLKGGVEEVAASLGILADVDLVGAEGGTHLRNMILSLQNPRNANAAKMFKKLKISAYDAQGNMRGLNEIFGDLNKSMDGMSQKKKDSILATIFKQTDLSAANAMIKNCGDRFDELYEAAANSSQGIGAAAKMYATQMDNLEGDIDILKSGLSDLGITIYKDVNSPLRGMVQLATEMVGNLSEAYGAGGMEGMVGAVGGCLSEVVNEIASYAPKVVGMGISLLENLVGGITSNSGQIAGAAADVLTVFVEGLFTLVPEVITAGIDIVSQFVQGVTAQLPQLISSGTQAIVNFVNGIIQRLPEIIATALALVQTLVNSISANAPSLIAAAVQLIMGFLTGIVQMLPSLVQMGLQLVLNLVQGLISNLPLILQTGVQLVMSLVNSITQMLPTIIQSGIELVISLIQGIIANLGNIVQAAVQIVMALITGLIQAIPQIWMIVPRLGYAIVEAIFTTDWAEVGIDIIKGLIDGIVSTGKSLWSAIKSLFTGEEVELPDVSVGGEAAGATGSISTGAFSNIDTSAAAAAGMTAGMAFTDGLAGSVEGGRLDGTGLNASMAEAGTAGAAAFTGGLNSGLADAAMNNGIAAANAQGLSEGLAAAGAQSAEAVGTGLAEGSQAAAQAATVMGTEINTALDSAWGKARESAQAAMQQLASAVTGAANSTANAVKAAFENMVITIPKPKIPVLSVSEDTVQYSGGGNVKVPKFSVNWNAVGGIFSRPTIFNTSAGMQGVGEAGAEAVLPLDILWAKMKEIVGQAGEGGREKSVIEDLVERLKDVRTGKGGTGTPELAGVGGFGIQYSPVYNLYGNAGKQDAVEAERISQAEFDKLMKQWERDNKRRKL